MNRVKPPYKFKSPYWTHDKLGKLGIKHGLETVNFFKCPIEIRKYGNSELNYYKACTLDIESISIELLKILVDKKFKYRLEE